MSKKEKLLRQIMNLDKNLRIEEVKRLMEDFGYEGHYPPSGSSHYTFRKEGRMPITVPVHGVISVEYIKQIKAAIVIELKEGDGANE